MTLGKSALILVLLPPNDSAWAPKKTSLVDTMGLWGEAGINGKDELFMDNLVENAVEAGIEAYSSKKRGILTYGYTKTEGLLRDSREPYVFDENIYQIKFIPNDKTESTPA